MEGLVAHWDEVYRRGRPGELSWFQAEPTVSLELIDELGVGVDAAVVDVGGGMSPLAGRLLERGFRDVTVLDVSGAGIAAARSRLGTSAGEVKWLVADVREWRAERRYDLWHDRAVLHFLIEAADRRRYLDALDCAVGPDGAAVIATFASDGPETCSGLPVVRYDPADLTVLLGPSWTLAATRREEHVTPVGRVQPFTWVAFRRSA